MQNIYIIGGSNSLLGNGWTAHFRSDFSDRYQIANLAIGAATSLIGIYRVLRGEVPRGSTVIWEYALNESNHFRAGQSLDSLLHHLDWFMEIARQRDIRVLPLVFWTQTEHLSSEHNPYRKALQGRMAEYGLPVVDAWQPLLDLASDMNVAPASLFSDKMHYSVETDFLHRISDLVSDRVVDASIPKPVARLDGASLALRSPTGPCDTFRNSKFSADIFHLDTDLVVEAKGNLLASFVISANDAGAVSVSGDGSLIGTYSLQGAPAGSNTPIRLLKHLVHWRTLADLRNVQDRLVISGTNPTARPIVQNMFAWRGPLSDQPRMDAYICALIEQNG